MKKKTSASSKDLWKITLAEASARIQAASLSPVELLEAYLDRIAEVGDPMVGSPAQRSQCGFVSR